MDHQRNLSSERQASLERRIELSLDNMQRATLSYVYEGKRSAYQTVATELRKLLLDKDAPRSWVKGTKRQSLFELVHGRRDDIHINGLPSDGSVPCFLHPELMLAYAGSDIELEPMKDWLSRSYVTSPDGLARTHETLLRDVADKEGAHIIGSRSGKDAWKGFGIGLISESADDLEKGEQLMEMWRQLVVFAGAKLLMAKKWTNGEMLPLFDYQWPGGRSAGYEQLPDLKPWTIVLTSGVELRASLCARPGTRLSDNCHW